MSSFIERYLKPHFKKYDSTDIIPTASVARKKSEKRDVDMDVMAIRQRVRNAIDVATKDGGRNAFVSGEWLDIDASRASERGNSAYLLVKEELVRKGYSLTYSSRFIKNTYPYAGMIEKGLHISWG